MNFLELCKETARIAGTIAGMPSFTDVAGATGRVAKLTGGVNDAWVNIQNSRTDWLWQRRFFDEALIADKSSYTAVNLNLTRVGQWMPDRVGFNTFSIYDPAIGKADEGDICYVSHDAWRQMYGKGVHDANRPCHWSIDPATRALLVGPTPDKIYNISGEYRASAQQLAVNADIPEMPVDYHRVIIAEAIRLLSKSDEAYQAMLAEDQEFMRLHNGLVFDQTLYIEMGDGPLA